MLTLEVKGLKADGKKAISILPSGREGRDDREGGRGKQNCFFLPSREEKKRKRLEGGGRREWGKKNHPPHTNLGTGECSFPYLPSGGGGGGTRRERLKGKKRDDNIFFFYE